MYQSLSKNAFNHPGFHRRQAVDREASAMISAAAETRRQSYESFLHCRETNANAGGFSLECAEQLKNQRIDLRIQMGKDKLEQGLRLAPDKGC